MTPIIYSSVILALSVIGLVFSLQFLFTHRPKHWRRWESFDASGWVIIVTLAYTRTLILVISGWPVGAHGGLAQACIGIGLSALVDALVILRVVAYQRYRKIDREKNGSAAH